MNNPIYIGTRNFLGLKDLVISFYTEKCPFNCSCCGLKTRSCEGKVTEENIIHQIDTVFDRYASKLHTIKQISAGNEGSILDRRRFPEASMEHLLMRSEEIPEMQTLSLETRADYLNQKYLEKIMETMGAKTLDITIGFETQDDYLRNSVLNKRLHKSKFERKVGLLGEMGIRLTSYVMLKPAPFMSEQDGVQEAIKTITYLHKLCSENNTELVIYLNPTYIANNSRLAKVMRQSDYKPPTSQSILRTILATESLGTPIYTGLWSENLSDEPAYVTSYDKKIIRAIKRFNSRQNHALLKPLENPPKQYYPSCAS